MKHSKKTLFMVLGSLTGLLLAVILISAVIFSPGYMYRVLINGESKVTDYMFFPERTIEKSTSIYHYQYEIDNTLYYTKSWATGINTERGVE